MEYLHCAGMCIYMHVCELKLTQYNAYHYQYHYPHQDYQCNAIRGVWYIYMVYIWYMAYGIWCMYGIHMVSMSSGQLQDMSEEQAVALIFGKLQPEGAVIKALKLVNQGDAVMPCDQSVYKLFVSASRATVAIIRSDIILHFSMYLIIIVNSCCCPDSLTWFVCRHGSVRDVDPQRRSAQRYHDQRREVSQFSINVLKSCAVTCAVIACAVVSHHISGLLACAACLLALCCFWRQDAGGLADRAATGGGGAGGWVV